MLEAQHVLERLQKLAAKDNRPLALPEVAERSSALFTFVTRERERIAGCAFARAFDRGDRRGLEGTRDHGTADALRRGHRSGSARRLSRRCGQRPRSRKRRLPRDLHRLSRRTCGAGGPFVPAATCRSAQSICRSTGHSLPHIHHAGEGMAAGTPPPALIEHRVMEVLMVLGMRGVPARRGRRRQATRVRSLSAGNRTGPGRPIPSPPNSAPAMQR